MSTAIATSAQARHDEIAQGCKAIRAAWFLLAGKLYDFRNDEAWRDLGFGSFNEWLRSPDIELSRAHADTLTRAWRELVVDRGIDPTELRGIDLAKINAALPALRDGRLSVPDFLLDGKKLSRAEFRGLYSIETRTKQQPHAQRCPNCGVIL